jgi:hypothetical protein
MRLEGMTTCEGKAAFLLSLLPILSQGIISRKIIISLLPLVCTPSCSLLGRVLAFRGAIPVLAHDAITDNLVYFFDIVFIPLLCVAVESVRG